MLGILRFWPLGFAVLAFIAGWTVNGWRIDGMIDEAISLTKESERAECQKAQQTTKEVSDALQTKLRGIGRDHAAALNRLRAENRCVPVAGTTGGHDAGAGGDQLPRQAPVAAVDLIDLAAVADRQTAQLIACQDFVKRITE